MSTPPAELSVCDEIRDAALADLAEREPDEPCLAVHGVAVLESLDFEPEFCTREAFEKLKGRPCGKVREFAEYSKTKKPEVRRHLLTMFARRVPVVDS